jgi:SIR2-like domain
VTGVVVFLGAGATKSCGGPLTSEILPQILQAKGAPIPKPRWDLHGRQAQRLRVPAWLHFSAVSVPGTQERLNILGDFLRDLFHITEASPAQLYPSLPLVMSLLDTAIDRRQAFHPQWDLARISEVREAVEAGIFGLLEKTLKDAPTNNHYILLDKVLGSSQEPCIISTNYDLIIDTAMMFFSQNRGHAGRLPDYRCHIRTDFYLSAPARFGILLKLHGSLNWLYCKTCDRLEIGASEAQKYVSALANVVGPSLAQFYTPHGSPCPTCRTKLRPLLIAPSHVKDYRNPHVTNVWYEAEQVLRNAQRAIFIGYSLPDDDVEVIYLLKRSLAHMPPAQITVVQYDPSRPPITSHPVGCRYRTLFGDDVDWHPEGIDAWLSNKPSIESVS